MTETEIAKHISEKLDSEIKGCSSYLDMTKIAMEKDDSELAMALSEMAKDEYTHAHFIFTYMAEMGMEVPEETRHAFYALKKRIEAFPRG